MHKVLVVADPHITRPGKLIIGLDPRARLEKLLAKAAGEHADAGRLILLGDLTNWGGPNEYAELRACIDALPWPVHFMIGNHDNRANFLAAFPDAARTGAGHVQEAIDLPGWRLITLDSHDEAFAEPLGSGILCAQRMAWLDQALAQAGGRQVALFIHHPPMRSFLAGMDRIGLRNRDALLELVQAHGTVAHIFAGHVHRTVSASWSGLPVSTFKSPCHQVPLQFGTDSFSDSVDQPGAFGVLLFDDEGVTVHSEDVP